MSPSCHATAALLPQLLSLSPPFPRCPRPERSAFRCCSPSGAGWARGTRCGRSRWLANPLFRSTRTSSDSHKVAHESVTPRARWPDPAVPCSRHQPPVPTPLDSRAARWSACGRAFNAARSDFDSSPGIPAEPCLGKSRQMRSGRRERCPWRRHRLVRRQAVRGRAVAARARRRSGPAAQAPVASDGTLSGRAEPGREPQVFCMGRSASVGRALQGPEVMSRLRGEGEGSGL